MTIPRQFKKHFRKCDYAAIDAFLNENRFPMEVEFSLDIKLYYKFTDHEIVRRGIMGNQILGTTNQTQFMYYGRKYTIFGVDKSTIV